MSHTHIYNRLLFQGISGTQNYCFIEVRTTKQGLQQLCTGCAGGADVEQTCESMRDQNFASGRWGQTIDDLNDQCRPE